MSDKLQLSLSFDQLKLVRLKLMHYALSFDEYDLIYDERQ